MGGISRWESCSFKLIIHSEYFLWIFPLNIGVIDMFRGPRWWNICRLTRHTISITKHYIRFELFSQPSSLPFYWNIHGAVFYPIELQILYYRQYCKSLYFERNIQANFKCQRRNKISICIILKSIQCWLFMMNLALRHLCIEE